MTVSVRNILSKRGINVDPSCLMCFIASEFVLDLLRDCSVDNSFWSTILDVPANVSIHSPFLYLTGLNSIVPLLFLILKVKFLGKFCFPLTFGIYGLIVIELFLVVIVLLQILFPLLYPWLPISLHFQVPRSC
jgi:hypothetical protein